MLNIALSLCQDIQIISHANYLAVYSYALMLAISWSSVLSGKKAMDAIRLDICGRH